MRAWTSLPVDFLRGAWRKLPVETLAVCAAAASAIALVHGLENVWVVRVLLGALLVTPIAFAAHGRGRAVELGVGAAAVAGVGAALVAAVATPGDVGRDAFMWPYGLALLAAALAPFVVAAPRFTGFVRRFFEQLSIWGLLWLGALAAQAVVFLALAELFDLRVQRLGADVGLVLTGAFVLTFLHRLLPGEPRAEGGRVPEIWRRLATTVGAPFVAVMLVILVVYELFVLARGELPRNLLSPLFMTAGFVGFLCTLIISAVAAEPAGSPALAPADPHRFTRRWSVRLTRAFPLVLLALLPLAAWALLVRIDQYGLTPFRVVRLASLLCLGTLSLLGAVRWLRRRAPLSWEVPAAVLVFALATAVGPTSAVELSIVSQSRRVARLLDEAGVTDRRVPAVAPAAVKEIEAGRGEALRDGLQTLADLGGAAAVGRVLSGEVVHCTARWSGARTCLELLGLASGEPTPLTYDSAEVAGPFAVGPGELVFVELDRYGQKTSGALALSETAVTVTEGGKTARASLEALIADWQAGGALPLRPISFVDDAGIASGRLVVRRLEILRPPGGKAEVARLSGAWLR